MTVRSILQRLAAAAALGAALLAPPAFAQQNVLKVVMHSDLKTVDPIWTTAYITRNHRLRRPIYPLDPETTR